LYAFGDFEGAEKCYLRLLDIDSEHGKASQMLEKIEQKSSMMIARARKTIQAGKYQRYS